MSTSLHGRHDLDLVAVPEWRGGPGAARHDLAVDGSRDAGRRRRQLRYGERDRAAVGQVARLAVEFHLNAHRVPPAGARAAKRPGPNGSHSGAGGWPVSQATIASAVTGDIRMPFR